MRGIRWAVVVAMVGAVLTSAPGARAAAGDLDTTFAGTGVIDLPAPYGGTANVQSVAIDSQGRTVVAFDAKSQRVGGDSDVFAFRLLPDGTFDPSFGNGGKVQYDLYEQSQLVYDVAVDRYDSVYIAGQTAGPTGQGSRLLVVRLQDDGSVDIGYGDSGRFEHSQANAAHAAVGIEVDSLDRAVIATQPVEATPTYSDPRFGAMRLLQGGTLDPSFGTGGEALANVAVGGGCVEQPNDLAVNPSGAVAVVGWVSCGTESDMVVVRFTSGGQLDTGFDGDGIGVHANGGGYDGFWDARFDPQSRLLAVGWLGDDFAVARFESNLQLDTTFDGDGMAVHDFAGGYDYAYGVGVDASGNVFVMGETDGDFGVLAYSSTGQLDPSFSGDGIATHDFGGYNAPYAGTVDLEGRPVLAGYGQETPSGTNIGLLRYQGIGATDPVNAVTEEVAPGEVTTVETAAPPSPTDPVQVALVTSPDGAGGTVSISEVLTTETPQTSSYQFLPGMQVSISAPQGSVDNPLLLTFRIDESALAAAGMSWSTISIARNGVVLGPCTTDPLPCVDSRSPLDIPTATGAVIEVRTVQASEWNFARHVPFGGAGFEAPVDDAPIINTAKAGSTIPVKFDLGGDHGARVLADGSPYSYRQDSACDAGAASDVIEATLAGTRSGLTYDPVTGLYEYAWKTSRTWTGCRVLVLQLLDGSERTATFRFR